jgi:hypothetical protein
MSYENHLSAHYRVIRARLRPKPAVTNVGLPAPPDITIPDPTPIPDNLPPIKAERAPVRSIIRCVCRTSGVTFIDVVSHRRTRRVVRPRQLIMYLARHLTTFSLPQIGRQLGGRDHTTVLHGISAITRALGESAPVIDPEALLRDVVSAHWLALTEKSR